MRRGGYFVALLLAALVMGLEFAHVLEWPSKATYQGSLYVLLQESLYIWFGNIGSVLYLLAIVISFLLALALRGDRSGRRLVGIACALEVLALALFFAVIYPVNLAFPVFGPVTVPADWAALRDRWELGHAVGFALFTAAFVLLLLAVLRTVPKRADEVRR